MVSGKTSIALMFLTAIAPSHETFAGQISRTAMGKLTDGTAIEAITLSNAKGIEARVITYGATLQAVVVPDRNGERRDVVLGYDDVASFEKHPNYFGVTVGRYANRIANGRFELDGRTYQLAQNNNGNALHGGKQGFDKKVWRIESVTDKPNPSVTLFYRSADGEEGYPGELATTVTYTLDDAGALTIAFEAKTTKPTIVNLTNHAIFNLAGEGAERDALGHRLMIPASKFTPVNETLIPTGELRSVAGTAFDFRKPRTLASGIRDGNDAQIRVGRGYDHNFVLDKGVTKTPELVARLEDPESGRVLEVLSTEPCVQLYTGNFLDGTLVGKQGHVYRMGDGIALEPQQAPDSPNQPALGSARVDPGKPYRHVMVYRFSAK